MNIKIAFWFRLKRVFVVTVLLFTSNSLIADEGMWLISLISNNINKMNDLGFKLTAEDIYSINKSSLKDAAVQLDDGSCSAEIISPKGLILTNHHCAVGDVQNLSSIEHNYLRDGFWAKTQTDELPVPGKTALILLKAEDVTERIYAQVGAYQNSADFFNRIEIATKQLKLETEMADKNIYARIVPMFNYNSFYLFVYNRYTDVRLVGVPPATIGNFGGDLDNWHWPRHTGDFTLYRIYTNAEGNPADYNSKNIPLKPKHHYPVSLKGIGEGDFAMVVGYPGQTFRYSSSDQAQQSRDLVAPWVDKYWGEYIQIIKEGMKSDPLTKIQYTNSHDGLVNIWQKEVWQAQSMKTFSVVEYLKSREDSLIAWAMADSINRTSFINVMPTIRQYYKTAQENNWDELFRTLTSLTSWPIEVNKYFYEVYDLFTLISAENPSKRKIKREAKRIAKNVDEIYNDYHADIDMRLYATALKSLIRYIPKDINDPILQSIIKTENQDYIIPLLTKHFYEKSFFTSPQALKQFLKNPTLESLSNDPLFMLNISYELIHKQLLDSLSQIGPDYKYAMHTFTKGLLQMNSEKLSYPDANSTLRVSYGTVMGYKPSDAVSYRPFTYIDGIIEKNSTHEEAYAIPEKIRVLWSDKNFGEYTDSTGSIPVSFITNNDISNGNSGSPVLNANGHLVGVAFDGNYEAMACDFAFEPSMQRTIICDIRYVLFVIDKYAEAKHLINEMTIVR